MISVVPLRSIEICSSIVMWAQFTGGVADQALGLQLDVEPEGLSAPKTHSPIGAMNTGYLAPSTRSHTERLFQVRLHPHPTLPRVSLRRGRGT